MTDLLSRLQVGKKIGEGCFGEVFEGADDVHGRVAVKMIRKDHPDAESASDWADRKAALLAEAQVLKRAKHPNVVDVFHLVEAADGDSLLYVMHFCEGGSLQRPYEIGPLPLVEVRKIATDVTMGLAALHARGMLHRDVKPSNLLLDDERFKLGDFGLVTDRLVLGYGSAAGYADHVAPEVWASQPTSARSDIWALGVTLYRLLHGLALYGAKPAPSTLVKKGRFADTLKWLPHIPGSWRRVIRQMLRDDPDERFRTAQDVQNALARLPVSSWAVAVQPAEIRWERVTGSRRQIAVWTRGGPGKHSWSAWSEPLSGSGRRHGLGESKTLAGEQLIRKELERFFEARG